MKIRPASLEDIPAIVRLENATHQLPWTSQQFISSMEVGHYSVVLEEAETILGFAIYSPIIPESHLLNIAIDPKHQGKGLGKKLLKKIIFQNKTIGVTTISLEVRASNRTAINLYKNMGFLKDAIRAEYYSGTPREDALLMSARI